MRDQNCISRYVRGIMTHRDSGLENSLAGGPLDVGALDLRSGVSLWRDRSTPWDVGPPLTDLHCEVAIVGGGVSGAMLAYTLAAEGVDALLVDRRTLGAGSTAASTGLLQYEVDTPLCELIPLVGEERAVRSYRLGLRAIAQIESWCEALNDDCGFHRRPTMYLASQADHEQKIRAEFECRQSFGFDVRLLTSSDLAANTAFRAPAALWSTGDAEIDPLRLTLALLHGAASKGARLFSGVEVNQIHGNRGAWQIKTPTGMLTAKQIVFAAGYETAGLLKQHTGTLKSTFALATRPTEPVEGWPDRCLVWESARPYRYLRSTQDGRIIIGGLDMPGAEAHHDRRLLAAKGAELQVALANLFPGLHFEVDRVWGGTFGESPDGLPFIGTPVETPGWLFALGYGGNGITFSAIAARLLADIVLGRPNGERDLFRFDR